jgi:hypothetical protein
LSIRDPSCLCDKNIGNPERKALVGHHLNTIKQSELSIFWIVIKPFDFPRFGKEGIGEILSIKILKKSPLTPLF